MILEWLKRIIGAAIRGFIASWGNPVGGEVAAVEEVGKIAVEEITNHEKAQTTPVESQTAVPENQTNDRPISLGEDTVVPGPTTFDKPVDESYGKNRKH